jgi:hypothetical protein
MIKMQEMSLNFHFEVEQTVGSAAHAFFLNSTDTYNNLPINSTAELLHFEGCFRFSLDASVNKQDIRESGQLFCWHIIKWCWIFGKEFTTSVAQVCFVTNQWTISHVCQKKPRMRTQARPQN